MIAGQVNAYRDAVVRLTLHDVNSQPVEIEFVVDTGFSGSLTLPPNTIAALGLQWHSRTTVTLANGASEDCDVYAGKVLWEGTLRNVAVEEADTEPLLGMRLLHGHQLLVDVIDGGMVKIQPLPSTP